MLLVVPFGRLAPGTSRDIVSCSMPRTMHNSSILKPSGKRWNDVERVNLLRVGFEHDRLSDRKPYPCEKFHELH